MISFRHKGNFSNTTRYLERAKRVSKMVDFRKYGDAGVAALASATPVETGKTAQSWYYNIYEKNGRTVISFNNSNVQDGVLIAIILQYGHGNRDGGWVEGRDFINPAIQPVFDKIVDDAWREVSKL